MDDKPKLRPVEVFPVREGRRTMVCIRDATGLSDRVVTASAEIVGVLQLLDGTHTVLDIQASLTRRQGVLVMSDDVRKMLEVLDEAFLLEGERFAEYHRRLHEEFASAPVRRAASAGTGYPGDADELVGFLDGILAEAESTPVKKLRGLIAPHIDHHRGRKTYAEAFAALAAAAPADLYVLLGTSHAETVERFALTRKDFETPLGLARTDVETVDELLKRSGRDLTRDEFVHRGEHSIEL
ncbi:MAG TPA: AmmeMemoRadiSam system protein B, partial [Planctomycetota bacterium]|nr:AmmeMemoRadiSam system protein B [Planctomycetota bacterium]